MQLYLLPTSNSDLASKVPFSLDPKQVYTPVCLYFRYLNVSSLSFILFFVISTLLGDNHVTGERLKHLILAQSVPLYTVWIEGDTVP